MAGRAKSAARDVLAMFPLGYRSQNSRTSDLRLWQSSRNRLHTAAAAGKGEDMHMHCQGLSVDLSALDLLGLELTCASAR